MTLRSVLGRYRPRRIKDRRGLERRLAVSRRVSEICGGTVARGPFAGLRLPEVLPDTSAKLLGSYERELHGTLERLLQDDFDAVVNVGCSDGYYVLGALRRLGAVQGFAFDLHESFRRAATATAAANDVTLQVEAACTPVRLRELCASRKVLLICDCEGCEEALIAPETTESATVLVELHPGTESLPQRFGCGYAVQLIESGSRDPDDYPELTELDREDRVLAVFERPGPQTWALIEPV